MTTKRRSTAKKSPQGKDIRWKSLTGHNYHDSVTGEERRVEKGEEMLNFPESAVRHELAAGNIDRIREEKEPEVKEENEESTQDENGGDG